MKLTIAGWLLSFGFVWIGQAEEFSIQIAGPVAAQTYKMKSSAFVFRTLGCADPAKAEVTVTAEGQVDGRRQSVPLKVSQAATPGVYGVFRSWSAQGIWVVSISAKCESAAAGVLVATSETGFIRESSRFLKHAATESEIAAALKAKN